MLSQSAYPSLGVPTLHMETNNKKIHPFWFCKRVLGPITIIPLLDMYK